MFRKISAEYEQQHWPVPSVEDEFELPVIDLRDCQWHSKRKVLVASSALIGMPRQFMVHSHHTDREVRFVAIGPEDRLFSEDGWDGEQCVYRPTSVLANVDHMVITHSL